MAICVLGSEFGSSIPWRAYLGSLPSTRLWTIMCHVPAAMVGRTTGMQQTCLLCRERHLALMREQRARLQRHDQQEREQHTKVGSVLRFFRRRVVCRFGSLCPLQSCAVHEPHPTGCWTRSWGCDTA